MSRERLASGAGPSWSRRLLAVGALVLLLLAGYWFWLRDSSLVAVERVEVRGASTDRAEIGAALEGAAKQMTTLNVDEQELVRAVSAFPTVASISTDADPPHKLTITVTERLPVAVVELDGEPVGVSAGGLLLPGAELEGRQLPPLEAAAEGGAVDAEGVEQAAILGAAPPRLRRRIEGSLFDPERGGVVLDLEGAPEARFGDGSEAEAKWRALAAVLLVSGSGSAGYVDVSVPGRPVSGG